MTIIFPITKGKEHIEMCASQLLLVVAKTFLILGPQWWGRRSQQCTAMVSSPYCWSCYFAGLEMLWLWLPQGCVRVAKTPFTPHWDNSVNNLQKPEGSGRYFGELEPHKLHKILHLNCDGHYQTKSVQALACAWDKTDKRLCFDRKKQKKNNWKAITKSNVSNCKSKAQFCDSHRLTLAIILYLATSLWLAPINTENQLIWK